MWTGHHEYLVLYILFYTLVSSLAAMDAVLDQVRDAVEAPIVSPLPSSLDIHADSTQDFEGQRLATLVNYAFLSTFGVRFLHSLPFDPHIHKASESRP
jgi:hypothetical protein